MNNEIESLTYYAATKKYDLRFPTLEEDLDVDVVIIGGGFSGINTALELAEGASPTSPFSKAAIWATAVPGATAAR